jgi:hypothetical protein
VNFGSWVPTLHLDIISRVPVLEPIVHSDHPSSADSPFEVADKIDETALAQVMRVVPLGAGVLAGGAVALLVLGYLAIYLLVFLPRGTVG